MEFDLRDWLLILGPVFVSGVLIHGYWRMRRGKGDLKMSLDKSFLSTPGDEETIDDLSFLKAELPNGGARVIQGSPTVPDAEELELEKDVPVLLEPIVLDDSEILEADDQAGRSEDSPAEREQESDDDSIVARAPPAVKAAAIEKPEMFVLITVLAHEEFDGQPLLEELNELDMTFGEMDIFHRMARDGSTEFSLANVVEPGTFNPSQMDKLKTPGMTLFMRAHELPEPLRVYDAMVEVAQKLADELGGELRDQSKSVMTSQTIEHLRQSIQDFQYKHSA